METPGLSEPLSTLAEDLLLLSFRARSGGLATEQRIDFGLAAAQLVQLASLGRITVSREQIQAGDTTPTGDPELDAALADLARARQPLLADDWVRRPWSGIRTAYLARLMAAGALRAEPGGVLGRTRWRIADPDRAARARARLDAVAGSGGEIGAADAALGGLAHAVRLDKFLYPGRRGHALRDRLAVIASGPRETSVPTVPSPRLDDDILVELAIVGATSQAATHAAERAATESAHQAGLHLIHHAGGGYADDGHVAVAHLHHH